jgi:hypothetical protein
MNPSEPTMATPAKLIFTINEISSREGFVVTSRRRLVESRNSLRFNVKILLIYVTELLPWVSMEMKTPVF